MAKKAKADSGLDALVRLTKFAVVPKNESFRYSPRYLSALIDNGCKNILVESENGLTRLVATDGYRLAMTEAPLSGIAPGLYPADAVGQGTPEAVKDFPNWRGVLPDWDTIKSRRSFAADRDGLVYHLKLARLMADPCSHQVALDVNGAMLIVSAHCTDRGEYSGEMALSRPATGKPLRWSCNADYLLDFLRAAVPGPIFVQWQHAEWAGEFTALGESDVRNRYLLMPIRE